MAAGHPDLDPVWGLLTRDVADKGGADCEAAIAAMAAGDPELDPVWGLLTGDAESDGESHQAPVLASRAAAADAAAVAPQEERSRSLERRLPERTLTSHEREEDVNTDACAPAVSSTAPPGPQKKPISNVVDKAEVSWECFKLPSSELPSSEAAAAAVAAVTRHEVKGCDAFYLDNVLSAEECAALVSQGDGLWSFWDDSETPRVTFRNACTIEVQHDAIADVIWQRVGHLVQPSLSFEDDDDPRFEVDIEGTWVPYAVNPRLLLSRYVGGGHFSPHTDGTTVVDFNRRTFYSCVLFLNESPWGGHTRLYADAQMQKELAPDAEGRLTGDPSLILDAVPPKPGRMVVFYHRLMHEGVPAAEKYIIRTDILYRRTPEQCTAPEDVEAFAMYQEAQLRAEQGECDMAADLFRRAFKRSEALRQVFRS